MLDELPMIYSALIMSYTMIEHYNVKRKYGYYLPAMLALHAAITTVLVSLPVLAPNYASPILQFIAFHLSFAALEVFLFRSQINIWRQERNPTARRLHLAGFSLWLTGIGCWLMDYLGCEFLWEGENSLRKQFLTHLPNPQYHSWWHICASGGLYTLTIAVAYHRQSTILGITDTEIVMCYGVLPALRRKLQKSIPKVRVSQTQKSSKAD
jgi:predicted membrane channel-forming protein YqfA (hemolysin III family)